MASRDAKMSMRFEKWLAQYGGLSRSEANKSIRRKQVTINGVVCNIPKQKVHRTDSICLDGMAIVEPPLVLAFHKPTGMITANSDPQGRSCVGDWLPHRYHIVGRLDQDTHGLLLFSRDGQYTQYLLHPKRSIEREYIAKVDGVPTSDLVERLAVGIDTGVGLAQATVLNISGGAVRLTVSEGRNRVVRRMLHNAGHSVLELQRVRFGSIELGDLPVGQTRALTESEMAMFAD